MELGVPFEEVVEHPAGLTQYSFPGCRSDADSRPGSEPVPSVTALHGILSCMSHGTLPKGWVDYDIDNDKTQPRFGARAVC